MRIYSMAGCLCVVATLGLGCATTQVSIDYDHAADFSALETYAWVEPHREESTSGERAHPLVENNTLLEGRIREAVDRWMAVRGFELIEDSSQADLTVHFHVMVDERQMFLTTRDHEVYSGGAMATVERTDLISYTQGTLIVDIHRNEGDALVWRAIGRDVVDDLIGDPERQRRAIDRTVGLMLADSPP